MRSLGNLNQRAWMGTKAGHGREELGRQGRKEGRWRQEGMTGEVLGESVAINWCCCGPGQNGCSLPPQRSKSLSLHSLYIGNGFKRPSSLSTREKVLMGGGIKGCLGSWAKGYLAELLIYTHPSLSFISALCTPACCE